MNRSSIIAISFGVGSMLVVAIVSIVSGDNWGTGMYFPNEVDYPLDGLTKEQVAEVTLTYRSCLIEHSNTECNQLFNEIVEKYKEENIGKDVKVRDGRNWVDP